VELGFIGQPYRDWQCGSTFLSDALADPTINRLLVLSAWVRESGLALIAPDLRALRDRGGKVDFFLGVDLKGSTVQGFRLAGELASTISVVHDHSGTFHPKVYLATGPSVGYALIGSNNLTAGGLSFNYEGALGLRFRTSEKPDFLKSIDLLSKRLSQDKEVCKRLTPALLKRLVAEGWLVDEDRDRRHSREDRARRRPVTPPGSAPIFGSSRFEKRSKAPPRNQERKSTKSRGSRKAGVSASQRQSVLTPDSWSKKLGVGDAQRSPMGNLTHVVRFTGVPANIKNRARFFRGVFFKDEQWHARRDSVGNRIEVANINVWASISGRDLGLKEVKIDYGAYRDERGRATTVLHWGDLMPDVLDSDLTGHYLLIERGPGAYSLSVSAKQPV
jgi:HKD family nuclease